MDGLTRQYAKMPEIKNKNSPLLIQRKKSSQSMKTPADRILFLQRTTGNQAVQRLIKSGALQAKLKIGQPGDKYEQEADRVADAVMRMPEPEVQRQVEPEEEEEETLQSKPLSGQITPLVQRQPHPVEEEEEETIQAKPLAGQIIPLVQRRDEEEPIQAMYTSGLIGNLQGKTEASQNKTGMPDHLKSGLENLSSTNLSSLRVHYNSSKPAQLNALAYTQGQDIHVGPGQEKHLPHECWHAVQQMQGRVKPTMQAKGVSINDDAQLEYEADVMGTKALHATRRLARKTQWFTITSHSEDVLQRRPDTTNPAPKRAKPDTHLLSRIKLYRIGVYGTRYMVSLDRLKNPWHAKYTLFALHLAGRVALVNQLFEKPPPPKTIVSKIEDLYVTRKIVLTGPSRLGPPEIDQYLASSISPGVVEIIRASLGLRWSEAGKRLRRQVGLGAFLDAAFVNFTRRWASIQASLSSEHLRKSGLSRRNLFTILNDKVLRNYLVILAMKHKATERLVEAFYADEALANGKREPRAADFEVLSDPERAVALVALAASLKEEIGQDAIDRRERARKYQLNEYLRPKPVRVKDVKNVLKMYDSSSTVTVDFLGPVQLKAGQKIVNAKGETIFLLSVSRYWIIYQNEADKRFYKQRPAGVQEELRFGVYALAAEEAKYIIPMTQFILRLTGALFPGAAYVYTATNILHVAGQINFYWDDLKALYENIRISRENIEKVNPGLFYAVVAAGVSASVAKLLHPKQLGLALDKWIIAALKIVRRVAAKKAVGQFATKAAVSALAKIWKSVKEIFFYVITLGRPIVVGRAGKREGGTSSSSLVEVANKLSVIGIVNASEYAKQLLGQTSDDHQLLIDEVEELFRNGEEFIQLLHKVTSW